MRTNLACKSVFEAGTLGAVLGFTMALVYGFLFVIYGILRTSAWVIAAPANGLLPTLLANAVSVLIGAIFIAILFGLVAALVQALTLMILYGIARRWNANNSARTGMWIGLLSAGGLFLALVLLFRTGPPFLMQVFWRQSFLFWVGMPGALYIALNGWLGSRLHFGAAPQPEASSQQPALAFTK